MLETEMLCFCLNLKYFFCHFMVHKWLGKWNTGKTPYRMNPEQELFECN